MTVNPQSVIPDGIYTPLPTFFKPNLDVDLDTLTKHSKMLYESGISGVVVSGSMGEASNLTAEERCQSIKAIRQEIPDENFKIIAGVPPTSALDVIAESKASAEAGADFLIVLVPGYFGPNLVSQQGIVDYFELVAAKTSLPIIIYNYPNTCNNVNISIDTFKALAAHQNIVGVKLTHYNFDMYTMLGHDEYFVNNNFKSFTGLGQVLIPSLAVNLFGTIDGLSGIFPKSMVHLFNLYKQGKTKEAAELQLLVTRVDLMITELNVLGVKYALNQTYGYGKFIGGRPPLSKPVDVEAYKKYDAYIQELAAYEKKL